MESTSISDPQRSLVVLRCVSDFYIFLVATSRVTAVPSGFGPHPPKSKRSKKNVAENSKTYFKKINKKTTFVRNYSSLLPRVGTDNRSLTEQRVAWLWLSACPIARPPGLGPGSDALHPLPQCPFKATRRGDMSNFWDLGFFLLSRAFF